MADSYVRVYPGRWKNSRTGQTVTSATDPGKAAAPKPGTQTGTQAGKPRGKQPILKKGNIITDVSSGTEANIKVANAQGRENIKINNPDYIGPDGTSRVTIDPETGKPTQVVTRSPGQETIASNQDNLTNAGLAYAGEGLKKLGQFDRTKVEDAVYNSLTRDTNRNEQQDQQGFEQSLNNRGIPYSADPNSRYQNEMKDFQNKYTDIRQGARNQAVITGGQEGRADYGSQLQGIQTAQQLGGGLRSTGTPGFTGTQETYGTPTDQDAALKALGISREQLAIAKQRLNNSGNSGNSGNGGSTTNPAFGG